MPPASFIAFTPYTPRPGPPKLMPLPAGMFRGIFTSVMLEDRYYIDRNGAVTRRMQGLPCEGHHDIAKEVLAEKGIVPRDYVDHYTQMFKLKFVRIVEHIDGRVEVEHTCKLNAHQNRYLKALEAAGKKLVYVSVKRQLNT